MCYHRCPSYRPPPQACFDEGYIMLLIIIVIRCKNTTKVRCEPLAKSVSLARYKPSANKMKNSMLNQRE